MGYAALVLNQESRDRLLALYLPFHPNVVAHHVTLQFGITEAEFNKAYESGSQACTVRGYARDSKADCVGVVLESGQEQQNNGTPLHVTISLADGTKPVYAGELAKQVEDSNMLMVLTGTLQYCK